ncbi:MAG TPA: S-layer homology domain-containing protein, partial [Firmicutes bacterium]|nr:S-layer homology domain-containing protein [Bacillota bacterium]
MSRFLISTVLRRRPRLARGVLLVLLSVALLVSSLPAMAQAARPGTPPGHAKKWAAQWQFADADRVSWGQNYMAKAKGKGLIQGYPGNLFGPERTVSCAEAVTMAVRLMGLETQ